MIRASLSKANHKYLTFLPQEGCDHLAAYLDKDLLKAKKSQYNHQ